MAHCIIAVAAVLFLCGAAWADYVSDRKAAAELVRTGKHDEALAAFVKPAEGVPDYRKQAWQERLNELQGGTK
jgi:hypothetical protein